MPNVNIKSNQNVLIKSGPKDSLEHDATLPSDVVWGADTGAFGTLVPEGVNNINARFTGNGGGGLGVTTIQMSCQGKTAQYTVTTVSGPFDHFSPTNDAPQDN